MEAVRRGRAARRAAPAVYGREHGAVRRIDRTERLDGRAHYSATVPPYSLTLVILSR